MIRRRLGLGSDTSSESLDNGGVYLSISDLMSGLLLIFVLLVMVLMYMLRDTLERVQERRVVIIQSLKETLEDEGIQAEVNEETGDVSIMDSILFDLGAYSLKPDGREFLDRFVPVYSGVIYSDPLFDAEIIRVMVEGHTSSRGTFESNMTLSLQRADSVLRYMQTELEYTNKEPFRTKLIGGGRGEIEAVQEADEPGDRKVVFRLQFRGLQIEELLGRGRQALQDGE